MIARRTKKRLLKNCVSNSEKLRGTLQLLQSRIKRIPLGWMGDGRDTANAALFLCSDEARFVTATEIVVDGGMSARCD